MLTLKQAKHKAKMLTEAQGVKWVIFITPADAPCNQKPANFYNEGRFACCKESEVAECQAGGAFFPAIPGWQEQITTN